MKKLFLLLIFFPFLNWSASAQDYVPFPSDSASWTQSNYYFDLFSGWFGDEFFLSGDTLISEISYKKIYLNSQGLPNVGGIHYLGGLRENQDNQIYFKPSEFFVSPEDNDSYFFASFPNTEERLLYDFGEIQVGDTLRYESSYHLDWYGYNFIVDNELNVEIDGVDRRAFGLKVPYMVYEPFTIDEVYFIEGIGCSLGLFAPYMTVSPNYSVTVIQRSILTCYETADISWQNTLHDDDLLTSIQACDVLNTSIDELKGYEVEMFPNPSTNGLFTIQSSANIETLELYSLQGKLVHSENVNSNSQLLRTSKLEPGIYIVVISIHGVRIMRRIEFT